MEMDESLSDRPGLADAHQHFPHPSYLESFMTILDDTGVQRFNLACLQHPVRLSTAPEAFFLKAHHPDRAYVSPCMDFSYYLTNPHDFGEAFADHVDALIAIGADGFKMWEGKPDVRRTYDLPAFDGPAYAPYWERLAERGRPIVFHLNDPEEFWDPVRIPEFARNEGWFYGDGDYVNNETQYDEVFRVLNRHPYLPIVFAHFGFFSSQLQRLGEVFETYPNVCVDLAPGSEMYRAFGHDPQASSDFFIRYQDRILFGTDFGAGAMLDDLRRQPRTETKRLAIDAGEARQVTRLITGMLEMPGEFELSNDGRASYLDLGWPLHGLGLPAEALAKIYGGNFLRVFGPTPRPLDPAGLADECARLMERIHTPGGLPAPVGDPSVAESVRQFFMAH
jgi:predicted TIM-barrel fold metal-dependent hydrolase